MTFQSRACSRYADVSGSRVHYVDEGTGSPLLLLHGNPTWSFLYRDIVRGLRDRYRCIAVDCPGFGLSSAAPGYDFTPAEHADVLEAARRAPGHLQRDDDGPGLGRPDRVRRRDAAPRALRGVRHRQHVGLAEERPGTQLSSRLLGGPIGRRLILNRNLFVERLLPGGVRRRTLSEAAINAYRGPFPTPGSRRPTAVFPREILASRPFLADVERRLTALRDRPARIVWPTRDVAFRDRERQRWEELFPNHRTVALEGAGHYIQEDAADEIVTAIRRQNA